MMKYFKILECRCQKGEILKVWVVLLMSFCFVLPAVAQNVASITTPDSGLKLETPILVSDQFSFTEGPAIDADGNVFFTDQPENRIWKYDTAGKLSLFMEPSGRSNGMYFAPDGNLISCADEQQQLWAISPHKEIKVLLKDYKGATFNGPNDVWVAPDGGMYVTDPYYQRDYWERTKPDPAIKGQNVYYLPQGSTTPVLVDSKILKPNGIVGTPDGKHLYISDREADKTYKYDINPDGTLFNKRVFVSKDSDGMTIDHLGNVYLTGHGVFIYSSEGEQIGYILIPQHWTSNITFYGEEKDYLFITATHGIYLVKTNVKGGN